MSDASGSRKLEIFCIGGCDQRCGWLHWPDGTQILASLDVVQVWQNKEAEGYLFTNDSFVD